MHIFRGLVLAIEFEIILTAGSVNETIRHVIAFEIPAVLEPW
jgi:hypothetical protein